MMANWRAVLPRHTAHQWRLTVSCEDGLCQLFTPRSQGGLKRAADSDRARYRSPSGVPVHPSTFERES